MTRKLFTKLANFTLLTVAVFLIFGCASTQTQKPSLVEVESFLDQGIGYLKIGPLASHKKKNPHPFVLLAQTEIGKKYLTVSQGDYSTSFRLGLTQFAIDSGAFETNGQFFVPIGTKKIQLVDQRIIEYPGGEYECHNEVDVAVSDLNEFGKEAASVFAIDKYWQPALERAKGGHYKLTLYKDKKSPNWTTLL